jgi:cation diffusion facilitator family transporter
MKKLLVITTLAICFMTVEIVGGVISGSLSILTDAAHQLSDVLGFALSIYAVKSSQKPSTLRHTYAMYRCEIMGAMATVFIIWGLLVFICYEAVKRIRDLDSFEIEGKSMLITACIALGFNIANLLVLMYAFNEEEEKKEPDLNQVAPTNEATAAVGKDGKEKPKENTNVRAAIIHLIGDGV